MRRVDLLELLSLYSVSDEKLRNNLIELCKESWRKGWWDQHRDDLRSDFINVPWLESRAMQICSYQHLNVHGLLQTRHYAESLVRSDSYPPAPAEQLDRWLEFRLERQRILSSSKQLRFTTIMEESALDRPIGNRDIMHEQLEYLASLTDQTNISVLIIETSVGSHLANTGSFVLYKLPEPYPEVANVETLSGSIYVEGSVDSAPQLAAQVVMALVNSDHPPLRLLLGSMVYDVAFNLSQQRMDTWAKWEQVSRAAEKAISQAEAF